MYKHSRVFVFVLILSVAVGLGASSTKAQTNTTTTPPPSGSQTFVLADVSLKNCSLSTKGTHLNITCGITNKLSAQSNIRYSVILVEKKTGVADDQKVYPDIISLKQNETVTKTIAYDAPSFLQGDFAVWVSLDTGDSLPLDRQPVGTVTLPAGASDSLFLSPSTCSLSIAGDPKKYTLLEGVDFDANEQVTVSCSGKNLSTNAALTVKPSFETHVRTLVGPVVPDTHDAQSAVSVNAGAEQTLSFTLPKALSPQAYDALLTLQTADGKSVSNTIRIHYVLRGASATVQMLSLNKDSYAAGDTAQIKFWWTGSADKFFGSRKPATDNQAKTVRFTLVDGGGNSCAAPLDTPVPTNPSGATPGSVSISVTKNCSNPSVTMSVIDASGKVLAEKSTALTTNGTTPTSSNNGSILPWIIGLIVLGFVGYGIKKYKASRVVKSGMMMLLFLAAGASAPHAHAATFTRADSDPASTHATNLVFTASLDKSTYVAGDPMTISGTILQADCSNGANYKASVSAFQDFDPLAVSTTFTLPSNLALNSIYYIQVGSAKFDWTSGTQLGNVLKYVVGNPMTPVPNVSTATISPSSPMPGQSVTINALLIRSSSASNVRATFQLFDLSGNQYTPLANVFPVNFIGSPQKDLTGGIKSAGYNYSATPFTATTTTGIYAITIADDVGEASGAWTFGEEVAGQLDYTVTDGSCSLPWGGTIADGASVTAYQNPTVISPATCSSGGNSETRTCTRGVLSGSYTNQSCSVLPPVPTVTFSVSPSTVNSGQSTTFTWSSTNATSCTSAGGFSTGNATSNNVGVSSGPLSSTANYQISCTGPGGTTQSSQQTVTVLHPQATITASPTRVTTGGSSTIAWNASDVPSCTISGPGVNSSSLSGNQTVTVNTQATYTITCGAITQSVTVDVTPVFKEF